MNLYQYKFLKVWSKKFSIGYLTSSGRSFSGRITVHHRSNGNKLKFMKVDFYRRLNSWGSLLKVIKNSYYTSYIGLILYDNGLSGLILLSEGFKLKTRYYSGTKLLSKEKRYFGNASILSNLNLFALISNLEVKPYKGMDYLRAAGVFGIYTSILGNNKALIKLRSGWNLQVSLNCICVLGKASNSSHMFNNIKKAGISRALGRRPTVRGVAMNPCDHPHGGGEGKKSGSRAARSPWGWLTKGVPSNNKKYQLVIKKKNKRIRT